MKNIIIAPSMLSANFANLNIDIEMVNKSQADWFHIDVMDGMFVPNISFGPVVIKHIQKYAKKPLDVHLMIMDPDRYFEEFKACGAEYLTIHYEACTHLHRSIQRIKSLGMKAGVALNPHTPVYLLTDIIEDLDMVLIMSVNPGFGGQSFIPQALRKITELRTMTENRNPDCIIEVDGGVGPNNIQKLIKAGANAFVAGNSVFASENPMETIALMKQ
jgi:ribulose-phosphate 3-epimerase